MKVRAKSLVWVVPLFLTGCIFHKTQTQPVQALAPAASIAPKPEPMHPDLPETAVTLPTQPTTATVNPPAKPEPKHRRTPKPVQQSTNTSPAAPVEVSGVSAIGQLSSGEPYDQRRETNDMIASTERGLNNLGRNLNDQEQKTAGQIKEYLKQAKDALNAGDVAGAHTLAAKAKVLLGELNT